MIPKFLNSLYLKLFRINDTPQRIALGMGLGAALGIIPGTGPLAALFLAFILKVNRASALLGSLLTNTWLSFLTFILAIKIGSVILRVNWQDVHQEWTAIFSRFNWPDLFRLPVLKTIFPVIIGYLAVALCLGLSVYLITLIIIIKVRHEKGARPG